MTVTMIATFGADHVHPVTGESLADRFVRVEGADEEAIRLTLNERFARRWSFLYPDEDRAGVDRYGLTEIDMPGPGSPLDSHEALVAWLATGPDAEAKRHVFGRLVERDGFDPARRAWAVAMGCSREGREGSAA